MYAQDGPNVVVIGSNNGNDREPAWSLNLRANAEASVQVGGEGRAVRAWPAVGEERERLWAVMNSRYAGFDDYRARTARDLTVFVLEPR
jgi:F420H(2)-dependent quinone reductase